MFTFSFIKAISTHLIGWHSFQFYSCFTKVLQLVQLHCSSNHIFQMPYTRLKTLPLYLLDWSPNNFLANCKSALMWNPHDISEQQQFAGISCRLKSLSKDKILHMLTLKLHWTMPTSWHLLCSPIQKFFKVIIITAAVVFVLWLFLKTFSFRHFFLNNTLFISQRIGS